MTDLAVRPLQDCDLAAAAALHRLSFPDDPWSEASLRDLMATPGIAGWIVGVADRRTARPAPPQGFLLARLAADEAEILTLSMAPAQRRRGGSSRLLEIALPSLAALGARRLFLEVAEDNDAARAFYGHWGFEQVGLRHQYYERPGARPVSALVMGRDLP